SSASRFLASSTRRFHSCTSSFDAVTIPFMRITAIDTYIAGNPWKNWVFAKVSTDEGIHGVGEGTLNCFGKTVETAIHELKPLAIGMDPFQVEIISQRLVRDVYTEGAQIHMCAVAAIEIALWDIIGKACNQPIYNLWGGQCHEKLRAYAHGWYRGPRHAGEFRRESQAGRRARIHGAQVRSVWLELAVPFTVRFRPRSGHHPGGPRRRGAAGGPADRRALPLQRGDRRGVRRSHPPVPAYVVRRARAAYQHSSHGGGGAPQSGAHRDGREPFDEAAVRGVAQARGREYPAA